MEQYFEFLDMNFFTRASVFPGSLGTFRYRFQRTGWLNKADSTIQVWVYENTSFELAQEIETEVFPWTEDGVETVCSAEFKTTVKGVSLAEKVVQVWMGAENVELSRMEYAPGELPESMTAAGDYLIVEEIAGETITRQLCQSGDETFTVYYQGEQPWCVPDVVTIHWPE